VIRIAMPATLMALAAASLASGCKVGLNYRAPHAETASAYGHTADPPQTRPAMTQRSVIDQGQAPWIKWWTQFGDTELDSLVARAVSANHELKIAAARTQEARAIKRIADSRLYPTIDIAASFAQTRGSAAGFGFPYGIPGMDSSLINSVLTLRMRWISSAVSGDRLKRRAHLPTLQKTIVARCWSRCSEKWHATASACARCKLAWQLLARTWMISGKR